MEHTLAGLLGSSLTVIVGLIIALVQLRRGNSRLGSLEVPDNPSSIHELAVGCKSRVSGITAALERIEAAQSTQTGVLVEIRTVLRERQ